MLDISVHVVSRYIQQRLWALDAPGDRRGRMQSPRAGELLRTQKLGSFYYFFIPTFLVLKK